MAQINLNRSLMDVATKMYSDFQNMTKEEVEQVYKHLPRSKRRKLLAIHKKLDKKKGKSNEKKSI